MGTLYNGTGNNSNTGFLVNAKTPLMLTLQQLKVFCAVAKHLHFTKAAEDLILTQPAVTFHIRSLERYFQLQLFDIHAHDIQLTTAGKSLLRDATEILNAVDSLERGMHQLADLHRGALRLGATRTIGSYLLPSILAGFHHAFPAIQLSVDISNTSSIEQSVLARALDLALVEWRTESPDIELTAFQTDDLVVAAPVTHRFGQRSEIEAEELAGEPIILREPGSGTRALALDSLGPVANRLNVVLELDSPEAIKRSVQAGLGVTIISETIIGAELERKTIVALRLAGRRMRRQFSLASLRTCSRSPATRAFYEFVLARFPQV